MKVLIPTAKELNETAASKEANPLSLHSQQVIRALSEMNLEQLMSFYGIKADRAQLEFDRIAKLVDGQAPHFAAIDLFDGLMYRSMERSDLNPEEKNYLHDHVLITSALYGVIPADTAIAPHRLDFMMKVKPNGKSLKTYWKDAYDKALEGEDKILSLLSSEFEMVFSKEIREKMIKVKFMEEKAGKLKVHSTISKKARGAMVTAMMKNQVKNLEEIKSLRVADFIYRADLSSAKEWVFVK